MNQYGFAPRVTFNALADTNAVDIANGETIRVWGFIAASTAGGTKTLTFRSSDGATTYLVISLTANTNQVSNVKWIADKGLEIVASAATVSVTVFHSNVE